MKTNYLPSDIRSSAHRETYYTVQKILSDRYNAALKKTASKRARRRLAKQFNDDLKYAIEYFVNEC